MSAAIFRDVSNSLSDCPSRTPNGDRPSAPTDVTSVGGCEPEQDAGKLGTACADQTGKSDDFACPNVKADVVHAGSPATYTAQFEYRLTNRNGLLGENRGDFAAHHQAN